MSQRLAEWVLVDGGVGAPSTTLRGMRAMQVWRRIALWGVVGTIIGMTVSGCGGGSTARTPATAATPVDEAETSAVRLQFDGLYSAEQASAPQYRHYLRLYADGSAVWAVSRGSPPQVGRWLSRVHDHSHRGRWRETDPGQIEIRVHPPGQHPSDAWDQSEHCVTLTGTYHRRFLALVMEQPGRQPSGALRFEFEAVALGL